MTAVATVPDDRIRVGRSVLAGVLLAAMLGLWTWQTLPSRETPAPVRRVVVMRPANPALLERTLIRELPDAWLRAARTLPLRGDATRAELVKALAALYEADRCRQPQHDCRVRVQDLQPYDFDLAALVDLANIDAVMSWQYGDETSVQFHYATQVPDNVLVDVALRGSRAPSVTIGYIID